MLEDTFAAHLETIREIDGLKGRTPIASINTASRHFITLGVTQLLVGFVAGIVIFKQSLRRPVVFKNIIEKSVGC